MANNEYSDPPEDIISSDIFGNYTSNYLTSWIIFYALKIGH